MADNQEIEVCSKCGIPQVMPPDPTGAVARGMCNSCTINVATVLAMITEVGPPQTWPKDAQLAFKQAFFLGFAKGFDRGLGWNQNADIRE